MIERDEVLDYLRRQRWFAGGDASAQVTGIETLPWLTHPTEGVGVRFALVTVSGVSGDQVYNLPLAYRREPVDENVYGLVGVRRVGEGEGDDGELFLYDALLDPEARRIVMRGFFASADGAGAGAAGGAPAEDGSTADDSAVEYVRRTAFGPDTDAPIGPDSTSVVLSAEQSNTSLVVDEVAMLKVFRRVVAGRNPDIEIHDALAGPGDDDIAALWGWISAPARDDVRPHYDLAMLQRFLRTASNGWDSARASVRDLLADADMAADEAGGDFAGDAERLGTTVAAVHGLMAERLETTTWGPEALGRLADRLSARLDGLLQRAPELETFAAGARARYDQVREMTGPVLAQRVHGDLHLGQTLRTTAGWKIIDFEGEPSAPLEDRIALDSPLRDVAGMLRSFDYAAYSYVVQANVTAAPSLAQADSWVARNRTAFLAGYGSVAASLAPLLVAYEVDKALYEYVYERDHRPDWISIPTTGLERMLG